MLLLKSNVHEMFPIEREKRRAALLAHHRSWTHLINHGTYGLISAERSHLTKHENQQRSQELYHHLVAHGHKPVPASGHYGGKPERSFMVSHNNPHELHRHMTELSNRFGQESYIVRHQDKHVMVYPHGSAEHPSPHYLSGTHIEHHIKSNEDRTVLHAGQGHTHTFRMNDFFSGGEHGPHEGMARSMSAEKKHKLHHVVIHTMRGPRRFTMHFDPTPRPLEELR